MSEELSMIVGRCLSGYQPAFVQLIERFRGQVFGLCYRMLGQREDAEDATQETFVRVARNLHRWDSARPFEPWLLTIAGNRCRTKLAKRMKQPTPISLDYPVEDRKPQSENASMLSEEVDLVLRDLRPEYRAAFQLFHHCELGYAEIADQLKVPIGTIKTWVHRARKDIIARLRLRGALGD